MPEARAAGWMVSGTNRARRYGRRSIDERAAPKLAADAADDGLAEMAGRQGSPYTGKLSARPAGKPGDSFLVEGEFATIPSTPPDSATAKNHPGRPGCVFQGMAESIWSDGVSTAKPKSKPNPGSGPNRLPMVGPGSRQKNAPGGSPSFSSSTDEFRPAIPRSGWSPPEPVFASPARTDYHAPAACLLKTGTFYFAGNRNFLLCLDTPDGVCLIFRCLR